ncbi:hypothetical protein ACRRTK_016965 [Alexandromys fortis]
MRRRFCWFPAGANSGVRWLVRARGCSEKEAGRLGEVLAAGKNRRRGVWHKASPSHGALGVLPSCSGDAAWRE